MGRLILLIVISLFSTATIAIEQGSVEISQFNDKSSSKLDTATIEQNAILNYNKIMQPVSELSKEDFLNTTSQALIDYKILFSQSPDNIDYCIKIAELYDKLGKDRLAKEFFYRGITLQPKSPLPYEKFGNFYYSRKFYRLALKQYTKAYHYDNSSYNVNQKIGNIYQKFGDTETALVYLKQAHNIKSTGQLSEKIQKLEDFKNNNAVYYQNTRIHFVED